MILRLVCTKRTIDLWSEDIVSQNGSVAAGQSKSMSVFGHDCVTDEIFHDLSKLRLWHFIGRIVEDKGCSGKNSTVHLANTARVTLGRMKNRTS